jgi:hypothetical protein
MGGGANIAVHRLTSKSIIWRRGASSATMHGTTSSHFVLPAIKGSINFQILRTTIALNHDGSKVASINADIRAGEAAKGLL